MSIEHPPAPARPSASPSAFRLGLAAAGIATVLAHWAFWMPHRTAAPFETAATLPAAAVGSTPFFRERFASGDATRQVHASSAYWTDDDGLTAFWYGGTEEGARDVSIFSARLADGIWSTPRVVVDRKHAKLELGRHVRKLGNMTVHRHPDGRIWLFYVSVSVGGWAASAVNRIESTDGGRTWSPARRLVTSPMLNVSTLVRSSAIRFTDGSIGLPVYHEFAGKFAEVLRIAPDGRVLGKTRLSSGRVALQPEIVVLGPRQAVALLRNAGPEPRRVLLASTDDAGRSWVAPEPLAVPNPDAALDVLATDDGRLLAVFNDVDGGRHRLTLAVSENRGRDWRTVRRLAVRPGETGTEADPGDYSYPWLMRAAPGEYHVLYTWNRTRIRHVAFNQSWLDHALRSADPDAPESSLTAANLR